MALSLLGASEGGRARADKLSKEKAFKLRKKQPGLGGKGEAPLAAAHAFDLKPWRGKRRIEPNDEVLKESSASEDASGWQFVTKTGSYVDDVRIYVQCDVVKVRLSLSSLDDTSKLRRDAGFDVDTDRSAYARVEECINTARINNRFDPNRWTSLLGRICESHGKDGDP